jgi:hypothetical protein
LKTTRIILYALLCAALLLGPSLSHAQLVSPTQLGQELASAIQSQAVAQNNALISQYTQAVAAYVAAYGTNPTSGAPAPPQAPILTSVNTALVVQDEVQWSTLVSAGQYAAAQAINWSAVYSTYTYVPPVPAPVVLPTICAPPGPPVNGCIDPVGPNSGAAAGNIYLTVVGDTSPNGTKFTDSRGTFVKTVVATPFGNSADWTLQ